MKPPMPEQPKTKEIPAVTPIDASPAAIMREIRGLRGAVDNLGNQLLDTRVEFQAKIDELQGSLSKHSEPIRQTSRDNLRQDAAIATLVVRTEAIEQNQATAAKERAETSANVLAIKKAVGGVLKHPAVIALGLALVYFLTAWLEKHTP